MRLKTLGKKPVRIRKFTDHGPTTGFYGPHVDQSECRFHVINHVIMLFLYFAQGNPCAIENSYNAEMHDYKICIEEKLLLISPSKHGIISLKQRRGHLAKYNCYKDNSPSITAQIDK